MVYHKASFAPFAVLMKARGLPDMAVESFRRHYHELLGGATGHLPERDIRPVESLPDMEALDPALSAVGREALSATALLKLNGGLGTSMGLDRAKSLIDVRPGLSFLRILCRQAAQSTAPLILMNSDRTREECHEALRAIHPDHPALKVWGFLQHLAPKVNRHDLGPARWPPNPEHEWYPPGHGDLYAALYCSGTLKALLEAGVRYLFVSNSDNLGATLDTRLLGYLVAHRLAFLMEVADRTAADRKGGHLARWPSGGLLLRESAQCPAEDRAAFEDVGRHRYFNTNNLWLDLVVLREWLENDAPYLPLIVNPKNVDPADPESPGVYQLESAMGAAIGLVPGAAAIRVPRTRFAPVKTTSDLLLLRSDRFDVSPWGDLVRTDPAHGELPQVSLDPRYFGRLGDFEARFPDGPPSLRHCTHLEVTGDIVFAGGVSLEGDVKVVNPGPFQRVLPGGRSYNGVVRLG
jgi:UTP--glucose-1-phosphate uridylyltransferase